MRSFIACALLFFVPNSPPVAGIEWQSSYELALIQAKAEGKVLFVAVNMDGERANDRMAKEVYKDKVITKLAAETVNLVASNNTHNTGSTCPRFGTVSCVEHRQVDQNVRKHVLAPDKNGYVVAPQHVFLDPEGQVILSVPYGVSEAELEWCFVTAIQKVNESFTHKLSSKARPPARLVMDGVIAGGGETAHPPMTREEALELIKELKKGRVEHKQEKIKRLVTADEPEAREFVTTTLRAGRASGGKRGAAPKDRRGELLRWIGVHSPPSYWEVAVEFISAGEESVRKEAIVALEQLGAPESLKDVSKHLGKESDPLIKKNLYRALGAVARDDRRARGTLIKRAGDGRDELLQANAILALGLVAPNEEVDETLREVLEEEGEDAQVAALLAMGLTRNEQWVEFLQGLPRDVTARRRSSAIEVSLGVLKGAPLSSMEELVMSAGGDHIPRARIFATSVKRTGGKNERPKRSAGEPDQEGEDSDDGLQNF